MLKLLIGVKGSGKTKNLISMVNEAVQMSGGSVVCVEKGIKLRYDINYRARLINTDEYFISDANSLYGFIAGILASNHDVSHIFVDAALRICNDDKKAFEQFVTEIEKLSDSHKVNIVMTSSLPVEEATEVIKRHL